MVCIVTMLLEGSSELPEVPLPETLCPVQQTDAYSCGYRVVTVVEEEIRLRRGEGRAIVVRHPDAARKMLKG